jgi:dienelactone hydrolase
MSTPLSAVLFLVIAIATVTAVSGQGVGLPADAFAKAGWQANPKTVEQASSQRPDINYVEARVPEYALPDALGTTGARVASPGEWSGRRAAILELFREHVYGRSPGRPDRLQFQRLQEDASAMAGTATLQRVAVVSGHAGREHRFEITLFLPNAPARPVPVFLLINNRPGRTRPIGREEPGFWPAERLVSRGYAIAALQNAELASDDRDRVREGVIELFEGSGSGPRLPDAGAAIAAWAWGARRAMDYFETESRIDAKRVAVVGHSRGGKAALWAGAEDERFALVVSNESGEGGAALSRRRFGETVERLTTAFPHWFAANYTKFAQHEEALPIDQHMLLALIAPRSLYVASADEDLWSDPRGEFLSLAHASPVYGLWGDRPIGPDDMPGLDRPLVVDRRGYHVRTGGHNLTPYDWDRFADFADAQWNRSPSAPR